MKATMNRNPSRQNKTIQPGWGKGLSDCAIRIKVKVNSLLVIEIFELILIEVSAFNMFKEMLLCTNHSEIFLFFANSVSIKYLNHLLLIPLLVVAKQ